MIQLEKDIFYSEANMFVRRANFNDLPHLADRMSEENIEELRVAHHLTPRAALEIALKTSILALTIEVDGTPVAIFGIRTENILGEKAEVYLLVTMDFEKIGKIFLRNARKFIDMFLEFYPYLEGYVYTENVKSIFWMKYCGAVIEEPIVWGEEGKLFSHFYFVNTKEHK